MPVPTTGSYKMFEESDSQAIRGAQQAKVPPDGVGGDNGDKFSKLKNKVRLPLLHPSYFQGDSKQDIDRSTNFRGYPIGTEFITCFKGTFEEITNYGYSQNCFTLHSLDGFATGSLSYSMAATSSEHCIWANSGSTLYVTVNTSSETTFEGWSYNQNVDDIISTTPTYTHNVGDEDFQVYALIKSDAIGIRTCYYSLLTGETARCGYCYDTRTVYFHRATYLTSSLEDLIWYKTADLSTVADNGYYRTFDYITGSNGEILKRIDNVNYAITSSGDAFPTSSCDGGFIYCS